MMGQNTSAKTPIGIFRKALLTKEVARYLLYLANCTVVHIEAHRAIEWEKIAFLIDANFCNASCRD